MMKHIFKSKFALFFVVVFLLTSCKNLTQFEIDYESQVVIPSTTGLNLPINLFTPEIESNSEQKFRLNDTRTNLIREIQLSSINLTIADPQDGNFGVLKSIRVFINADGLEEAEIAWNEDIPEDAGNELSLETTGKDLQEFIKKDEFTIRVNTVNREFIDQDHTVNVFSVFWVDAELI